LVLQLSWLVMGAQSTVGLVLRWMAVAALSVVARFLLTAAGVPIARWHYFAAGFAAVGLIAARTAFIAAASRRRALLIGGAFAVAMIGTVGAPWTSRDFFLMDFQRLRPGMTQEQVDTTMQKYMRGTGVRSLPGIDTIHTGSQSLASDADAAMLTPRGCEVYRHSNEGLWNADWGTVCYQAGRVVSTDFSPD
jgi:hypothetical protein